MKNPNQGFNDSSYGYKQHMEEKPTHERKGNQNNHEPAMPLAGGKKHQPDYSNIPDYRSPGQYD